MLREFNRAPNEEKEVVLGIEEAFERSGGFGRFQLLRTILGLYIFHSTITITYSLPFFLRGEIVCEGGEHKENENFACIPDVVCGNQNIKYTYAVEDIHHTIVSEFDLLCSFSFLGAICSAYFLGCLCFGYIYGQLADILGRKLTILIAILITIFGEALFLTAHINSKWLLILGGVFMGSSSFLSCVFNYVLDAVPGTWANFVIFVINSSWPITAVILGSIMLFDFSWRTLLSIIMFSNLIVIFIISFTSEGPRYLKSKGKYTEVNNYFQYIARRNKIWNFPKNAKLEVEMNREEKQYTILDVLKYPSISKNFVILIIIFMLAGSIFFGIVLDFSKMASSPQINTIIGGISEELGYVIFSLMANSRLGRRGSLIFTFILCAGGVVLYIINYNISGGSNLLGYFFLSVLRIGISGSYHIIWVFAAELFPTIIKGAVMGSVVTAGRAPLLVIPLLVEELHQPLYLFGAMAFFAAFITLFLPETRGNDMFDQIPELRETYNYSTQQIYSNSSKSLRPKTHPDSFQGDENYILLE